MKPWWTYLSSSFYFSLHWRLHYLSEAFWIYLSPVLSACEEYHFLHEDQCLDDCPKRYFPNVEQNECTPCHSDCAECDGPDEDECTSCGDYGYVRHNRKCLFRCPPETYLDGAECQGMVHILLHFELTRWWCMWFPTLQLNFFIYIFVISHLCSPSLHLFDQKNSNIVKYYYNLKWLLIVWIYSFM